MFDCHQTQDVFDLFLDRELESDQSEFMTQHLKLCAGCRHEFELIRAQNDLLTSSIRNQPYDTARLRAEIEAVTVRKSDI